MSKGENLSADKIEKPWAHHHIPLPPVTYGTRSGHLAKLLLMSMRICFMLMNVNSPRSNRGKECDKLTNSAMPTHVEGSCDYVVGLIEDMIQTESEGELKRQKKRNWWREATIYLMAFRRMYLQFTWRDQGPWRSCQRR